MVEFPNLVPALPEIFLALAGMALLMLGVFKGNESTRLVGHLSVLALICTAVLLVGLGAGRQVTFNGMFVVDGFAVFTKLLVLIGAGVAVVMSLGYIEREEMNRPEYPVLVVFATLGMLMVISANDLIALYVGMETMSLSLYVLAAFRRDSARSTEAGLKYFVLGALSSGLLLYGASLVYGFAGATGFDQIAKAIGTIGGPLTADTPVATQGIVIGMVFVIAGLIFKISAVPFHMWTPDVYEGSPTSVTAYFAAAPKVAGLALIMRILYDPFFGLSAQWQQVLVVVSVGSMVLGGFAAINQTNIKRLMAYSSIGNMGYALIGIAAGTAEGVRGVLIYIAIYVVMTLGAFAVILCMRQQGRAMEEIGHLAGLSRAHPLMALAMTIFMFSMAGIPPLAGFFGKLYVFLAAVQSGYYLLAVIGVVTSVVACYYYIRIVKLMYFDEPSENFDRQTDDRMSAVLVGTAVFTLFFFLFPGTVVDGASLAAKALIGG